MSDTRTEMQAHPVCPACGHEHHDAWEWNFGPGLEGERTGSCDHCGAGFVTEREVTIYFTTKLVSAALARKGE